MIYLVAVRERRDRTVFTPRQHPARALVPAVLGRGEEEEEEEEEEGGRHGKVQHRS